MEDIDPEPEHGRRVARLSLMLFDALASLHQLGPRERALLHAGALVHDVGMGVADRRHHKRSYALITTHPFRTWESGEVGFFALLARYHRKAAPSIRHRKYAALPERDRDAVRKLAAILRLADGLDRARLSTVEAVEASYDLETARLRLRSHGDSGIEIWRAQRKANLFESVFSRRLWIEVANGSRPKENPSLDTSLDYPSELQLAQDRPSTKQTLKARQRQVAASQIGPPACAFLQHGGEE
jgi:exopolyphosphatase/guanosine-5'-triphosphate,3'-diphosphate pyrophosphatase